MRKIYRPNAEHKESIKWNIYKSGIVVDLTISQWGAWAKLRSEDLGIKEVPELIHLGHKELMKKEHLAKINSVISRAWSFLYSNSFMFPFGNARFIPFTLVDKVVEKMRDLKKEFEEAVESFVSEFTARRDEMLLEYRTVFTKLLSQTRNGYNPESISMAVDNLVNKIDAKYPNVHQLQAKFDFDFVIFEVSVPTFEDTSDEDALDKARINVELAGVYKRKVSERIDTFLEDAVSRLKGMIFQTTNHMRKRLEAGNLNQKTIKSFVRFADSFKQLDFVGMDLDRQLDAFKKKISEAEKSELSDEQFKSQLQSEIDDIRKRAVDTDISDILGKYKRRITRPVEED